MHVELPEGGVGDAGTAEAVSRAGWLRSGSRSRSSKMCFALVDTWTKTGLWLRKPGPAFLFALVSGTWTKTGLRFAPPGSFEPHPNSFFRFARNACLESPSDPSKIGQ